ncbi:MAG TPA: 2-phospho-L-lactate transferase CofD family protein, partial [Candidatus Methanoperedens sp.]
DFWVRRRGEPEITGVDFRGLKKAKPTDEVISAFSSEENVIIGPSNPITSIGPILGIKGMKDLLAGKKVIAISPIIGDSPVSGPAGKLMKACGFPVSSAGVAGCYRDILDIMVIDHRDNADEKDFSVKTVRYDTMMTSVEKSKALSGYILGLLKIF